MSTTNTSTRRYSHRRFFTTALLTLSLSLTLTTTTTRAQASYDAPTPVSGPANARTSLKWYILAGQPSTVDGTLPIGQFFSLDLATNWSANTPAWKRLQPGPSQSIFPAIVTRDQKTMVVFHIDGPSSVYKYTVATDTWATSPISFPAAGWQGVGAVTDPSSGLVYLAGGYTDATRNSMDIYNPATDTASQSPLPNAATTFGARWYYGNVWSQQRKSVLYFGGYNITIQPGPLTAVTEFVPGSMSWNTMSTTGSAPSQRADHCMASNDNGSKLVVYGGRQVSGIFSGEVFILDTISGEWKQGAPGQPRIYAACTIAGNQLLIWGGTTTGNVMASSPVMIYNMDTNVWAQEYTAPADYVASASASATSTAKPTTSGSGSASGDGEKSGSNTGAIVGGIVGGIVVIAAIVGFLIYRRRQQRNTHLHTPVRSSDDKESGSSAHVSGSGNNNNSNRNEEELRRMQTQLENQQQQLELQRQLLALQQQQTVTSGPASQPAMVQQYQEPATPYGYQPPMYYPTVPTTLQTVQAVPDTSAAYGYSAAMPAVSGGHSEMYQQTTEPSFTPSPVVYMPADYILPPATSSPATPATVASSGVGVGRGGDVSSPYAVGSPSKKGQVSGPQSYVDGSGSWTENPQRNNPHTVIE
ncbi:Adagio protein 3 [Linnemannia gamsii]|uniref:Adagio protein 3 n=1 Tax=Linnemannia gamsii TaxID=64522 RepID=A0ABQ7K3J4_9FUNG|nr:Adagio protein 3 [Linnemannia gamsii]